MSSKGSGSSPGNRRPFAVECDGGVLLSVRVQPRASRCEVAGLSGEALKIRLTAPPVDGEANRRLIEFLSKLIGIRKGAITIVSGEGARDKRVRIDGARLDEVVRALCPGGDCG